MATSALIAEEELCCLDDAVADSFDMSPLMEEATAHVGCLCLGSVHMSLCVDLYVQFFCSHVLTPLS